MFSSGQNLAFLDRPVCENRFCRLKRRGDDAHPAAMACHDASLKRPSSIIAKREAISLDSAL